MYIFPVALVTVVVYASDCRLLVVALAVTTATT